MYEYHVVGVRKIEGIQKECDKRAQQGWVLHTAYMSAGNLSKVGQHVLIFEQKV